MKYQIGVFPLLIVFIVLIVIRYVQVKNRKEKMDTINIDEIWEETEHSALKTAEIIHNRTGIEYNICLKNVDKHFLKEIPLILVLQENLFKIPETAEIIQKQTGYDLDRITKNLQYEYKGYLELADLQERANWSKEN